MIDLDELRKLAEAATPGPWLIDSVREETDFGSYSVHGIKGVAPTRWYSDSDMAHTALDTLDYPDAEFIAAANPQVILELIERVRQATSDSKTVNEVLRNIIERLTAERDAALAAIERVRAVHRKDARLPDWPECTHCTVGMLQDPVDWPCDTIRALDGAPEPEWEWAVWAPGDDEPFSDIYQSRENLAEQETGIAWGDEQLVRRSKAGPWLPVEGSES